MCNLKYILTMLLLSFMVAASDYAEAAAVIRISANGTAAYSISATDLQEAAGIDLTVYYDSSALESPKVKPGTLASGAIMQENIDKPGVVRIVFITGGVIKGTGELASLMFTSTGKVLLQQPTVSFSVFSASGSQLAVQSSLSSPQPSAETKIDDVIKKSTGTGSSSNSNTSQTTTTVGSVLLPQDVGNKSDLARQDTRKDDLRDVPISQIDPAYVTEGSPAPRQDLAVAIKEETKAVVTVPTLKTTQSVLDRFRIYNDIHSLKRFSSLFDGTALRAAVFTQTPAIAVSDGKSLVTIAIYFKNDNDTPSFSLKGANQKAIRRISDKKWELDAIPQKDKSDVRLSIILKGESTEVPLVVVPALNSTGAALLALSEVALDSLLLKPLKNSKPAYDLNADGKQDYIDDYILVAHWLLKQQRSANRVGQKPTVTGK